MIKLRKFYDKLLTIKLVDWLIILLLPEILAFIAKIVIPIYISSSLFLPFQLNDIADALKIFPLALCFYVFFPTSDEHLQRLREMYMRGQPPSKKINELNKKNRLNAVLFFSLIRTSRDKESRSSDSHFCSTHS